MTRSIHPDSPDTRTCAIIVAAGDSERLGLVQGLRKPLLEIEGKSLLEHAAASFDACRAVTRLVIVAQARDHDAISKLAQVKGAFAKLTRLVEGGATRSDSVRAGVAAAGTEIRLVAIHDAARPLVTPKIITAAIDLAAREGAALVALPVTDTIKRADPEGRSAKTLERAGLWSAQTPQVFVRQQFQELLERAAADGFTPTDDAALFEHYCGPVPISPGDPSNLKITCPADLDLATALFARRHLGDTP
jgi:2-C-methyl-D-erythritol 4-phosphate cytidylyltransferase